MKKKTRHIIFVLCSDLQPRIDARRTAIGKPDRRACAPVFDGLPGYVSVSGHRVAEGSGDSR